MVETVFAAAPGAGGAGGFAAFIPLLLIISIWGWFNASIAGRKGKSKVVFFFVSLIPPIALFVSIYLASLTDKSILDKLDALETKPDIS